MEKGKFKLTRGTAVLIIIFAALLVTAAVIIRSSPRFSSGGLQSFIDASTLSGREKYLENLGWDIDRDTEEKTDIVIPETFGQVLSEYNKLQKQQGFDLTAYCGMECTQYTYSVTNYPEGGDVLVTLYVHGRQVVGGDIHSTNINGFMHTLT